MSKADSYIFELGDKVTRKSVSYKNRYRITISTDLYMVKDMDEAKKCPTLIIGPPYSGGELRHMSSLDFFMEDFSTAVDYVGTRPFVDRNKIGAIGICGKKKGQFIKGSIGSFARKKLNSR